MGLHHSIIMENLSLIIIEIDCAKFNRSFIHIFIKLGWWIGALKKERKETKKEDFKLKVNQPRSIQWKSIRHRKNEKSKKTQENCHPKATLNIMTVPFSALHTAKYDVLMWNLVCLSWSSLSDISAFCCFFVIIKDIFHCWFWVWGLLVFCKINGILVGSLFYCSKTVPYFDYCCFILHTETVSFQIMSKQTSRPMLLNWAVVAHIRSKYFY